MTNLLCGYLDEAKELSKVVYQDPNTGGTVPSGWTKITDTNLLNINGANGYYGEAYTDGNTVVIVSRGTEPYLGSPDFNSDFQMATGKLPAQLQDLEAFYNQLDGPNHLLNGKRVIFTGHSLGGSLSQLGAVEFGKEALTYDAYGAQPLIAGLNAARSAANQLSTNPSAYEGRIVNYITNSDIVGNSGTQIGQSLYIPGPQYNGTLNNFLQNLLSNVNNGVPVQVAPTGALLQTFIQDVNYHLLQSHNLSNFDGYNLENADLDPNITTTQSDIGKLFTQVGETLRKLALDIQNNPTVSFYYSNPEALMIKYVKNGVEQSYQINDGKKLLNVEQKFGISQNQLKSANPWLEDQTSDTGNVVLTKPNDKILIPKEFVKPSSYNDIINDALAVANGQNVKLFDKPIPEGVYLPASVSQGSETYEPVHYAYASKPSSTGLIISNIFNIVSWASSAYSILNSAIQAGLSAYSSYFAKSVSASIVPSGQTGAAAALVGQITENVFVDKTSKKIYIKAVCAGVAAGIKEAAIETLNEFGDEAIDRFIYKSGYDAVKNTTEFTAINLNTGTYSGKINVSNTLLDGKVDDNQVMPKPTRGCPLSLDLDGDGIETLNIDEKDIYFNTGNNSFITKTGWLKRDDALLAIDKDGNNLIDRQDELFGNETTSGFSILKTYDINNDNKIDLTEAKAAKLLIWQDKNENAITDTGELTLLSDMKNVNISLITQNIPVEQQEQNQNTITAKSTFSYIKADNTQTQGNIYNVNFAFNKIYTKYTGDYELSYDVINMPWLRGYGQVVDLQLAMSQNGSLKNLVIELSNISYAKGVYDRIDELIAKWTGAESIPANTMNGSVNAREVYVLNKFLNLGLTNNIPTDIESYIENSYKELKDKIFVDFIAQTKIGNAFEINYDYKNDSILYNDNTYKKLVTNLLDDNNFWASYMISKVMGQTDALDINKLVDNIKNEGYGSALIAFLNSGFQVLDSGEVQYLNPSMPHYIIGTSGNDNISGDDNVDIIYGLDGDDLLDGKNGDDFLIGGAGNDTLNGGDGSDTLSGGSGDDNLNGGAGNDSYIYDGDGADVVADQRWVTVAKQEWYVGGSWLWKKWESKWVYSDVEVDAGVDTVVFNKNISQDDINFKRVGNDLVFELIGTNNKLTLTNWYTSTEERIEKFLLPSGLLLKVKYEGTDVSDTLNGDLFQNIMNGKDGNDVIFGFEGEDTIIGGKGNDILDGGKNNDIYVFNKGDGQDEIADIDTGMIGKNNVLKFGDGITKNDLIFSYLGNDLVIQIKNSADKITIKNHFNTEDTCNKIETFKFSDGSTLNYSNIENAVFYGDISKGLYDSVSFDKLDILSNDDNTYDNSYGGDPYAYSYAYLNVGNIAYGLAGNDIINTGYGLDTIYGGIGNDFLNGSQNDDIYVFNKGDGNDVIYDAFIRLNKMDNGGFYDAIKFKNVLPEDINSVNRNGNDLIINYGINDQITIKDHFLVTHNYYSDNFNNYAMGDRLDNSIEDILFSNNLKYGLDYIQLGDFGNNGLTGSSNNEIISGGDGSDCINASSGSHLILGGKGDDFYTINDGYDIVIENSDEGTDWVIAQCNYTLSNNLEKLQMDGTTNINGTGNELDNYITGNKGDNILNGEAGNDTIYGGAGGVDIIHGGYGSDYIFAGAGNDNVYGDDGDDTILGEEDNDVLYGGNGNDYIIGGRQSLFLNDDGYDMLYGGAGNDTLDGGFSNDALIGGTGDDIYIIDNSADNITEIKDQGIDKAYSKVSFTLKAEVENLVLTGSSVINGIGNSSDNFITGNSANNLINGVTGNDTLDGLLGIDTMIGGTGNDVYYVDNSGDVITEYSNILSEIDTVNSNINYTLGSNVENLTLTSSNAFNGTGNSLDNAITGNSLDNILIGNEGNDILDGGIAGNDILIGGKGNDTYVINSSRIIITENLDEGSDLIQSSISYTLGNNIENLTLIGLSAIKVTGNNLDNKIVGNNLDNILNDGLSGADTLIGGIGNDTYLINSTRVTILENTGEGADLIQSSFSYTLENNTENLILIGIAATNGIGNNLDNVITGNSLDNILDAGISGNDTLIGSIGDDTYIISHTGLTIKESLNEGSDLIQSSISFTLGNNTENLILTGTDFINGAGNSLVNLIIGNSVNNILDGGSAGSDTLIGGTGNDSYIISHTGITITENFGEGTDAVYSTITYAMGNNIENLIIIGLGNHNATGNSLNNLIIGNSKNNILDGNKGIDTIKGGLGDDTYLIQSGAVCNIIEEMYDKNGIHGGTDWVRSYNSGYTLAPNVENMYMHKQTGYGNELNNLIDCISTSTYSNLIYGFDGNDTIYGYAGKDTLDGGTGADVLVGGVDNDVYYVDNTGDVITENLGTAEGTDLVNSSINYTLGSSLENLTLIGTSLINGTGNTQDNVITGNLADNILDGGIAGNDTLIGGLSNDTYLINYTGIIITENSDEGIDLILSSIDYTLGINLENLTLTENATIGTGNSLDNTITGNSLSNVITGNEGNDVINGLLGIDTMVGGIGNDTYYVENTGDLIIENSAEGTDTVNSCISYVLGSNLENLILTGSATSGTGNSLSNLIIGNSKNNTINGAKGLDTMIGGLGNDSYYVQGSVFNSILENENEGIDRALAYVSGYTLAPNVENMYMYRQTGYGNELDNLIDCISTYNYSNLIYGLDGNDTIYGYAGNDTLDGGTGSDILIGGLDNDVYCIDNTGDIITENSGEGTDIVNSSISYTLGDNLENLTLTGSSNINAIGNSYDNLITGNPANNIIDGGLVGADTLIGGLGNDTYLVNYSGIIVTENSDEGIDLLLSSIDYTLDSNIENLTLTGSSTIGTGNSLDNVITGNSLDNLITGNEGNDVLNGLLGIDTMVGGIGDDTYYVDNTGVTITENLNEGTDIVYSSIHYTLGSNVENLTLIGTSNINGTGNKLNNIMIGNSKNNTFNGGTGLDTMIGGLGNDSYISDNIGDTIIENANEGTDRVLAYANGYTLAPNVENMYMYRQTGYGNELDNLIDCISTYNYSNLIYGLDGNDTIYGYAGNDTLDGGMDNDIYIFNTEDGLDNITDSSGTDSIKLGNNVDKNKIAFFKDSTNFYLDYGNTAGADKLIVNSWNVANNQVEKLQLNDGTYLTNTDINSIIQNMLTYTTNNSITLTCVEDVKNNVSLMSLYMNNSWHN